MLCPLVERRTGPQRPECAVSRWPSEALPRTAAEAVSAATINAAYSLNRGDRLGSLEVGKAANFTLFNCEDYRELTYWFGMPHTHSVYVCGERVYGA